LPILLAGISYAHEPITTKLTWTQEISRIFYKRCVICHREGGASPMSLATYDEARPWAKAIKEEVLERRMPPWGAVRGIGDFRDDPSLTQPEIEIIVNWVEGGAPKGDDIYLATVPKFAPSAANKPALKRVLTAQTESTIPEEVNALSLRPENLPDKGQMEVAAHYPDGGVEQLIWIRDYRAKWRRTYVFRNPIRLPKGTRILVHSEPALASAVIAIERPGS
jgi:hypothetical protein